MASVSSLDKDMKNIRLSKYTPQAANEVRTWIESALGEQLQPGDLLQALKDGTTLCKPSQAIGGSGSPLKPPGSFNTSIQDSTPKGSGGGVSSWSRKTDEGKTAPAWNIHQYGYMGGASQGNQGISFGARRQITSDAPKVPSLAEKERKRREQEAEAGRLQKEQEQAEERRRKEEETMRRQEDQRREEEATRQREIERQRIEDEKRRWQEEERRWKAEEELRAKEEQDAEARLAIDRQRKKAHEDVRLTGQFLSQYQAEQKRQPSIGNSERERIQELERQLEEAKAREEQYERERQERLQGNQRRERSRSRPVPQYRRNESRSKSRTRSVPAFAFQEDEGPDREDERDFLRKQWQESQIQPEEAGPAKPPRPLPSPQPAREIPPLAPIPPLQPPRPLPIPQTSHLPAQGEHSKTPSPPPPSLPTRPLPDPANYTSSTSPTRKSPFARPQATPSPSIPTLSKSPASNTPSNPLRKPPFAKPSSLLSREMELDRQRQQEWEEAQKVTQAAAASGVRSSEAVTPGGGAWDTSQYGYLGGDSQNRGGEGINFGAARRQLVGPRDPPGKSSG
ncbi:uncharacterized protein KY384_006135 [Bacidia gigantensis]|uniref:uncharacterized protein n=1 Tax=Bacidia gigantensis TaxID=2732470 RepID=UPI001D04B950|nr:uncharacterized protein KY384_006135 [Bacidia gigantensis]KAG8529498.1 hypothetical protein KY384_006135 [Bacidia gigantensis]